MRLQMLIRDTEYRDALAGMISGMDMDMMIEMEEDSSRDGNSIILTDIRPEEIDEEVLGRIQGRTLFLSSVRRKEEGAGEGVHSSFKYGCISSIISDIFSLYHEWTGDSGSIIAASKTIAVASDSEMASLSSSLALARQIIYRAGGSVLILPLGYINDYPAPAGEGKGWFARMMYMIDEGRDFRIQSCTFRDSYGISYLMLPQGLNPVAGLERDYLGRLIRSLGDRFDTIILDIGTCYRRENIDIAARTDHVIFAGTGRRIADPLKILGSRIEPRLRNIRIGEDMDGTLVIDDYVREIFGA